MANLAVTRRRGSAKTGMAKRMLFVQDDIDEFMSKSFEDAEKFNLDPEWVTTESILKDSVSVADIVFVTNIFYGTVFDLLRSSNARIIGPIVVISALAQQKTIPRGLHPIFNLAMRDILVTCSSIEASKRNDIHSLIELMGGEVTREFTASVTHLIAGEIGSKKYHVATNLGIPIMSSEWVPKTWEVSKSNPSVIATQDDLLRLKCPVLKGCAICVTGIDISSRNRIKQLVVEHGGTYSGDMKVNSCTHLLAAKPSGQKYEYARQFKIKTVSPEWLFESASKGYALNEDLFEVTPDRSKTCEKTSTPVKDRVCANVSAADFSMISVNAVEETLAQSRIDISLIDTPYLEGCNVFLHNLEPTQAAALYKLLTKSGAIRLTSLTESVNVVITCGYDDSLDVTMNEIGIQPPVVSLQWLLDSANKLTQLPFRDYIVANLHTHNETVCQPSVDSLTVCSKTDSTFLNNDNASVTPSTLRQSLSNTLINRSNRLLASDGDMLETYKVSATGVSDETTDNNPSDDKIRSRNLNVSSKLPNQGKEPVSESIIGPRQFIFSSLKFNISPELGDDISQLKSVIENEGGIIVDELTELKQVDYLVTTVIGCYQKHPDYQLVTAVWVETCCKTQSYCPVSANPLFTPIDLTNNMLLDNLVLSTSGFSGYHKKSLIELATAAGAIVQEYLSRKANRTKKLKATRHLIAIEPSGSKYDAAERWKIPITSENWLIDIALTGKFASVDDYPITDENMIVNSAGTAGSTDNQTTKTLSNLCSISDCHDSSATVSRTTAPSFKPTTRFLPPATDVSPLVKCDDGDISISSADAATWDSAWKNAMEALVTPEEERKRKQKRMSVFGGIPVEKLMIEAVSIGNALNQGTTPPPSEYWDKQKSRPSVSQTSPRLSSILQECIVSFSKALTSNRRVTCSDIAISLGAEVRWTFDPSVVTHFVAAGASVDTEVRNAIQQGYEFVVVSPLWIEACRDNVTKLPEVNYPQSLNPKKHIEFSDGFQTPSIPKNFHSDSSIGTRNLGSATSTKMIATPCTVNKLVPPPVFNLEDVTDQFPEPAPSVISSESSELMKNDIAQLDKFLSTSGGLKGSNGKRKVDTATPLIKRTRMAPTDTPRCVESSQSSQQITWVDPVSESERERVKHKLNDLTSCDSGESCEHLAQIMAEQMSCESLDAANPPPLQLPIVAEHNLLSAAHALPPPKSPPAFMLSSLTKQERLEYAELIESLGGTMIDTSYYDPRVTHLVVGKPARTEKYLAAVASGKWILHKSYLEACRDGCMWMDEAPHEWGGPGTFGIRGLLAAEVKLSMAACRWRKSTGISENCAFRGWKVVLHCQKQEKASSFKRVLEAGGAVVLAVRVPFCSDFIGEITHAFMDGVASNIMSDISVLIKADVPCLKLEYIAEFLMSESVPDAKQFWLPEVHAIKS